MRLVGALLTVVAGTIPALAIETIYENHSNPFFIHTERPAEDYANLLKIRVCREMGIYISNAMVEFEAERVKERWKNEDQEELDSAWRVEAEQLEASEEFKTRKHPANLQWNDTCRDARERIEDRMEQKRRNEDGLLPETRAIIGDRP